MENADSDRWNGDDETFVTARCVNGPAAPSVTGSYPSVVTQIRPLPQAGSVQSVQDPARSPVALPGACQAEMGTRTLRVGSRGKDVQSLQRFLNCGGFLVASTGPGSSGSETEMFGIATMRALKRFQQAKGLVPDGVLGPKTRVVVAQG